MKLKTFDFIFIGLIIIILALSFWVFRLYQNNDNSTLEDLYKSKGRVELLERQLVKQILKADSVSILRDSISVLRLAEPKRRVVIINRYDEKLKNIDSQPVDSTLRSITDRLNTGR